MNKIRRKTKKKAADEKVKMTIRLLPEANERLRSHLRQQGDQSACVMAALDAFKITNVDRQIPRVSMDEAVPPTTVMLDLKVRLQLKQISTRIGASMNSLINGALMEWNPNEK